MWHHGRLLRAAALAAGLALGPLARESVGAQAPPPAGQDLLIRFDGPVTVASTEVGWSVGVVNGDATIDGRLRGGLLVVNGVARVSGSVDGPVIVVNGRADLAETARVGQELVLYRSTVNRAPGAIVGGDVVEERGLSFGRRFLIWLWTGSTLVLLVAATLFAAVGGRLLSRAATLIGAAPGRVSLTALATWVGLPVVALMATLTVVGVPLAVMVLGVLMPALWLLGYLAASSLLGARLLPLLGAHEDPDRPYGAATIGILAAQVVGLVPVLGGLVVLLAGVVGGGALVTLAVSHWRRPVTRVSGP